ncbi:hypothetical protein OSTOST_04029 [Ostertagia ostertagi]
MVVVSDPSQMESALHFARKASLIRTLTIGMLFHFFVPSITEKCEFIGPAILSPDEWLLYGHGNMIPANLKVPKDAHNGAAVTLVYPDGNRKGFFVTIALIKNEVSGHLI